MSAKMIGRKICRIKLHRRSRKEIRISPQVWFQAVNGLCLAEFKQWPSGQMKDKFSPIFRSLRLVARHVTVRQDELQEEPQGLQVGNRCAGCPDSEAAAQNLA